MNICWPLKTTQIFAEMAGSSGFWIEFRGQITIISYGTFLRLQVHIMPSSRSVSEFKPWLLSNDHLDQLGQKKLSVNLSCHKKFHLVSRYLQDEILSPKNSFTFQPPKIMNWLEIDFEFSTCITKEQVSFKLTKHCVDIINMESLIVKHIHKYPLPTGHVTYRTNIYIQFVVACALFKDG